MDGAPKFWKIFAKVVVVTIFLALLAKGLTSCSPQENVMYKSGIEQFLELPRYAVYESSEKAIRIQNKLARKGIKPKRVGNVLEVYGYHIEATNVFKRSIIKPKYIHEWSKEYLNLRR